MGVHRGRRVLEQEWKCRDRHRRHGLADEEDQADRGQTQPGETRHGKAQKDSESGAFGLRCGTHGDVRERHVRSLNN